MDMIKNYELQLAQRVGDGDRNAFREIVDDHKKKIFYFAYDLTGSTQDAEDLSQEVFIKAYRSMKSFNGQAALGTWLYRITLNTFLDQKRKKSAKIEKTMHPLDERLASQDVFDPTPGSGSPEQFTESRQMQVHINQAMGALSPRERAVFTMRHFQGMAGKQVGKILDISEGTVKSLLSRAMKKLQKGLGFYREILCKEMVR